MTEMMITLSLLYLCGYCVLGGSDGNCAERTKMIIMLSVTMMLALALVMVVSMAAILPTGCNFFAVTTAAMASCYHDTVVAVAAAASLFSRASSIIA